VRAIQKRLADRGYYDGPLDGSLGPKTSLAIETYQRVQRYNATGQPSRAIYEELEDYALQVRGLDQFNKGAYDAAVATYSRIIRREPKNADAYFNRGLAYKNVGRTEQALTDYDAAIELDPDHRKAHFDRANILYDQGDYGEALRTYYKALKLLLNIS
jgi:tetratricopeptide (TPR) repeat protein